MFSAAHVATAPIGVSMYQRIITYTRMFRERWMTPDSIVFHADGISTADAAVNPTLGGVHGRGAICFCTAGA